MKAIAKLREEGQAKGREKRGTGGLYHDQVTVCQFNSIQFKWNIDLTTNIGVAIEDVLVWLLLSGRGGGGMGGGWITIFRISWWPQLFYSQLLIWLNRTEWSPLWSVII